MKPPSDNARQLLEQYRASLTLGAEHKARLGGLIEERALRGDLPRFDVADAAPSVPEPTLIQKLWSSTMGKLALGVLAVGAAGTAGQLLSNDEPAPSWPRPPVAQVAPAAPRGSALPETPLAPAPLPEPKADSKPLAPRTPSSHAGVAPPAESSEPTIDEEVKLVNAAQAALRAGDTRRSFELLAQHAARFPSGKLVTLRQVTQMMTLCQAGRRAEARRQATAFLASKPSSPFAERVKSICVD